MISRPQRLLSEALTFSAEKFPDKTAVHVKNEEFSYKYLQESAENLAAYLYSQGIQKGDRVAVYLNNSWQSAVAVYGISMAGAVFLLINPQTKAAKLNYILNDSGSKVIISESQLLNELLSSLEGLSELSQIIISGDIPKISHIVQSVTDFEQIIQHRISGFQLPQIIPNDLAALIYTSGSTGFPKGVMMTHQSMVFTSWSLIEYLRLTEEEKIMLVLPLAFDYGLYQMIMAITIGGTLIIEQSFSFPPAIFRQIEKLKPSVFPGVPSIYAMMIEMHKKTGIKFECIQKITNTAAALPAEFISDLKKIFPNALIFKMYGLTECKRVSYLEPELVDAKPQSVGKVFLLTPEGKAVPAGESGILHVRGPHVMAGYWKNEKLSQEMLKPGSIPGERILCAHDLFRMDEEGFLYFLGRNDDIIKTRGEKVSPVEVENAIYQINGVKEAVVMGTPDVFLGESIIAFMTIHENFTINEKDVQKECMKNLESFMVPQRIIILPELPKSSNGKIDRAELKKLLNAEK